jgi:hypothetical protein
LGLGLQATILHCTASKLDLEKLNLAISAVLLCSRFSFDDIFVHEAKLV